MLEKTSKTKKFVEIFCKAFFYFLKIFCLRHLVLISFQTTNSLFIHKPLGLGLKNKMPLQKPSSSPDENRVESTFSYTNAS
jgi:hypothetical protein